MRFQAAPKAPLFLPIQKVLSEFAHSLKFCLQTSQKLRGKKPSAVVSPISYAEAFRRSVSKQALSQIFLPFFHIPNSQQKFPQVLPRR